MSSPSPDDPASPAAPAPSAYERMFRDAPLPMWVYDLDTLRFLDVNDVACTVYGWPRDEFLRLALADIRPAEEVERMQESAWSPQPRWTRSGPWIHRTRDGRRMPVDIVSQSTEFAGRRARQVMAIDLTEQLRTQQAFEGSRERLALAVTSGRIGLWEWDVAADWMQVSEHWAAMLGTTVEAFGTPAAKALRGLYHPDDYPSVRAHLEALLGGTSDEVEQEHRLRHADGHWIWVLARARVVARGPGGEALRLIGANIDVSERREAERLRRERELALQAVRLKSEFVARASHELRTPLNAVLGFCQLLQIADADPLSERQRHQVQTIEGAGRHLLALVGDLLQLSSLEAGRIEMARETVALTPLAAEVAELIRPQAELRDVRVQVLASDAGAPQAVADPVRLRQALLNLASNGVKYNRKGGQLSLRPFGDARAAGIEVRDTGVGMAQTQVEHLFEPFNRLGRDRGGVEGTGIGLAITRQLIERMQGRIEVRSVEGQGSVFTLHLPAVVSTAPA